MVSRIALWGFLLTLNLFCFGVIYVIIKIGLAYGYTVEEWTSVLIPTSGNAEEIFRWLMLLAVLAIPALTLVLIVRALRKPSQNA